MADAMRGATRVRFAIVHAFSPSDLIDPFLGYGFDEQGIEPPSYPEDHE